MMLDRTTRVASRTALGIALLGLATCDLALSQTTPPPPPSAPVSQPPSVALTANAIEASGLTPSSSIVVFGLARRSEIYWQSLERTAEIVPSDATGQARLELDQEMAWKSVWFVVDIPSGQYIATVPDGFVLDQIEFPGRGIGAALNILESEGESKEYLWVRPGLGAWTLTALDGGSNDGDGNADRRIRAEVSHFKPLGTGPAAPEKFSPGDVVVSVDYRSWTVNSARRGA
jgi:hypothetical protein